MTRWLLWTLAGLILGGIVHLGTILVLPRTASQDAYDRIEPITQVNVMTAIPGPAPAKAVLPFMDPAFAVAVCRYDLARGPMKLTAPVSQAYTSVTFYTRLGVAYYGINDRAAGRRTIELYLMTTPQREALPEEEDVTAADRLIIESPSVTGLIVLRALSPEPGLMPMAQASVASARCLTQPQTR
jgi:uncharacterized membrane protein